MSAVKFTLCAALVAASFAVLAVVPAANAQADAQAVTVSGCNAIQVLQTPAGEDLTVRISVNESDPVLTGVCLRLAAQKTCKQQNFRSAVDLVEDGSQISGRCEPFPANRFDFIATDCNERDIVVLREPESVSDVDTSIRVRVKEANQAATCGPAACTEACKFIGFDRAFGFTERFFEEGNFVEAQCSFF